MTTETAVSAAAAIMAELETLAHTAKTKCRDLRPLFKEINDNGDAGLLVTRSMSSKADALGTQFEADVWALHAELTELAKARGIDLPSTEGGGGR
jgi:hypothetical protein